MSHRLPIPPETLPGMTTGQVVQMRDHLAQKYYWRFGYQVPFDVLRDAGQSAIMDTITAAPIPMDTATLASLLYHQIKDAMLSTWQATKYEGTSLWQE